MTIFFAQSMHVAIGSPDHHATVEFRIALEFGDHFVCYDVGDLGSQEMLGEIGVG